MLALRHCQIFASVLRTRKLAADSERQCFEWERSNGLHFVHIPMLPYVSTLALEGPLTFARSFQSKAFVDSCSSRHGNLPRSRNSSFSRLFEQEREREKGRRRSPAREKGRHTACLRIFAARKISRTFRRPRTSSCRDGVRISRSRLGCTPRIRRSVVSWCREGRGTRSIEICLVEFRGAVECDTFCGMPEDGGIAQPHCSDSLLFLDCKNGK